MSTELSVKPVQLPRRSRGHFSAASPSLVVSTRPLVKLAISHSSVETPADVQTVATVESTGVLVDEQLAALSFQACTADRNLLKKRTLSKRLARGLTSYPISCGSCLR